MKIFLSILALIAAFSFEANCAPNKNITIVKRIINGNPVDKNSDVLKYMVSVRFIPDDEGIGPGYGHYCGGVMVSKDTVLTAAYCMPNVRVGLMSVWMGDVDITKKQGNDNKIFTSKVKEYIRHPKYNYTGNKHPIALIKLLTPNENFVKLTINNAVLDKEINDCVISGWGQTKENGTHSAILRSGKIKILPRNKCVGNPPEGVFCAPFNKDTAPDFDPCFKDQGGPVVCNNKLYGLIIEESCGANKYQPYYADIGFYTDLIQETV